MAGALQHPLDVSFSCGSRDAIYGSDERTLVSSNGLDIVAPPFRAADAGLKPD